MKTITWTSVGGLCVFVLLSACAKTPPPEEPPPAAPVTEAPTQYPDKDPARSQIVIGPKIAEACGIAETDTYFDYNSADLSASASRVLEAVATCFTSGPLAGRNLRIVGHADPRGDEEYNLALGGRRADNVAGHISGRGMPSDKIETSSRGEMDARGTEEQSWKQDRKVELFLAD